MQGIEKTQGGRCALIIACAGFALCATAGVATAEDRTFDGTGNNVVNTGWGSAHTHLLRVGPVSYPDGSSMVTDRPNPRAISNAIFSQSSSVRNVRGLTDMVWQWGQFLDHDIDITGGGGEFEPIIVPLDDPTFTPGGVIPFAETHVMEHGIYVLEGKAVYRLNQDWVEVEAGDFLWLRAFCPQACYAGGPGKFRYLLYKDMNRHPRLSL